MSTRRPALEWAFGTDATAATLERCRDRACGDRLGEPIYLESTRFVPVEDLPTGVVFWRLVADGHPEEPSVARVDLHFGANAGVGEMAAASLTVNALAQVVGVGDVDGDGVPDLAVTAVDGSPTVLRGTPDGFLPEAEPGSVAHLESASGLGPEPAASIETW